ncbi:MAG TPA: PAS domain S-box protein [Candidatus Dormibacteraeota bacterium]|nr:PAS domain S-box protein [Candidatus Dormibacteraeota bacterium]
MEAAGLAINSDVFGPMLEAMPDGVVVVGADGRIVLVNRRTESLSGYTRDDLVGMSVDELVPDGLRVGHAALRDGYAEAPSLRQMSPEREVRLRRRDGTEFPADIALSPLTVGDVSLVVASVRDVTQRVQREGERRRIQALMQLVVDNVRDYAVYMLDTEGRIVFWSPGSERIKGFKREQVMGQHVSMFYLQTDVESGQPARELADAAAAGRYIGEGWRVRGDGSRFWAGYVITALFNDGGQLSGYAKMTRDFTDRKYQDDHIRAALEVAQATLEGRDETALLRLVSSRARALVEADLATVAVFEAESGALVVRAGDGPQAAANEGRILPVGGTVMGHLIATGEPLLIGDAEREAPPEARAGLAAEGVGSLMLVRLASGDKALGVISASNAPGQRPFTPQDLQLVELFAAQAAVAIDFQRARDELRRLAVLEDRERIGRDLHDGAIQALFAVGMGLQGMAMMASDAGLRGRLEGAVTEIDQVIRDLRNYIFGLRPGAVADRQVSQALQALAEQLESHRVSCAVDVDPAVASRLAGHAADVVQVAREALSNVGRHAAATTCRLTLRLDGREAVLQIEDDGRGFVPDERRDIGWGLRNLAERAQRLGGSLEISSVPGEGTSVSLRVPL